MHLQALVVGEVPLQVRRRHVDDLDARVVDLQVLLKVLGDVDDHLKAPVEDVLEAAVVLFHGALEIAHLALAALEVKKGRHPHDLVV
jgi:hypothetical protein